MKRNRIKTLALEARITSVSSEIFTEDCATGAILFFNITATSGTGGLTLQLRGRDGEGNAVVFWESASLTTTGVRAYILNPSTLSAAASGITAISQIVLPQVYDFNIVNADSSSHTFSLTHETF